MRRYSSEAALALLGDALEEAAALPALHWRVLCYEASRLSEDADQVSSSYTPYPTPHMLCTLERQYNILSHQWSYVSSLPIYKQVLQK